MDLPTSWIDAWTISKVMAEGLKYEQVSSELLKHIQEILTSLVKHYGSILKQLNCIKIVHIMKFIILCKAAVGHSIFHPLEIVNNIFHFSRML